MENNIIHMINKLPPYYSATQLSMLQRCPRQYYYRYVLGIKSKPGAALSLGSGVHTSLEHNYTQKIESHNDRPLSEVQEVFAASLETRKDDTSWTDMKYEKALDIGTNLIREYQTYYAPQIQPVAVEKEFLISLPGVSKPIKGFIDIIDDNGIIRDHKVVGRAKKKRDLETSLQLGIYSMAYKEDNGKLPNMVSFDCLVKTAKGKVEQVGMKPEEDRLMRTLRIIQDLDKQIQAMLFPANEEGWWCSKKWCGYYDRCQKELK